MNLSPSALRPLRDALRQAWLQRSPREQQLLRLACVVLLLTVLWTLALAPAWRIWQVAPAQQARLDAQTQHMRALQAQAQNLKKPTAVSRAEAVRWLESSVDTLGAGAKISWQGDQANLRVEAAPADQLARWLSQARERAQALPLQAQMQQTQPSAVPVKGLPPGPAAPTGPAASANVSGDKASSVYWRGTLVLRLPANP